MYDACKTMKGTLILIFMVVLFNYGCKKEMPIEPINPFIEEVKVWQKVEGNWNTDINIENAFIRNNLLYLIADGVFMAVDSNSNLVMSTPLIHKLHPAFYYKPTFNDKYVIQVNASGRSIFIYEILNPQINKFIELDNAVSISAFGQLNYKNEIAIGLQSAKIIKLTFNSVADDINWAVDTIVSGERASRIYAFGENHYITGLNNWTYKFNSNTGIIQPIGEYRISNMVECNDTLYAVLFWTTLSGDGMIYSTDNGNSWYHVISNLRLDYYSLHQVNKRLVFSYYTKMHRFHLDNIEMMYYFKEMAGRGLFEEQPYSCEINSVLKLGSHVFVSTSKGLYIKSFEDFN